MKKTELGKSGLQVSQLCLGTMYFGTKTDQKQSENILGSFLDNGGNFIDTANNYAYWMKDGIGSESEKTIGNWLKFNSRDKIILATKCGARPKSPDAPFGEPQGLSYQTIISAVEDSLKRLQTDYVDVLYSHIDFQKYPIEERLKAFDQLIKAGKIRAIGTSNTRTWRIEESNNFSKQNGLAQYCCVQQKFSYLRPKYNADLSTQILIDKEMLDYIKNRNDLSLLAYSALLSGLYSSQNPLPDDYDTVDNTIRLKTLEELASEIGCTKNQLVLAWMMNQETNILPIISGSKVSQIQESVQSVNVNLSTEQLEKLNKAGD